MRRFVVALLSAGILAVPLALSAGIGAPAAADDTLTFIGTGYWCDGNGAGYCTTLYPGGQGVYQGEPVEAYPVSAGLWRWDLYRHGYVGKSTFTDGYIYNALGGLPIYVMQLHAFTNYCERNSAGGDVVNLCASPAAPAEEWVSDPSTGYLVNVGRSNDQDNWEVLCNPGGELQLTVTTRDACTNYHKEWAWVPA
jgi:hypothetical protein